MKARKQPVVVLALLKPYRRSLRRQDEVSELSHMQKVINFQARYFKRVGRTGLNHREK